MDFHGLSRKELQALCKLNKIPANITNIAMADALKSLPLVEGIEDLLNPSQSATAESPERTLTDTAAKAPPTGRRTCTRNKAIAAESESVQPMTKSTRRTTRRAISDEMMGESKVTFPKTPAAARSTRKTTVPEAEAEEKGGVTNTPALVTYSQRKDVAAGAVSTRRSNLKEGSTVQVYSTRRSTRLADKDVKSIAMGKEDKIDSLATELSKIDLVDVSDNLSLSGNNSTIVLQESVNKSDTVESQVLSNNKDDELHDEKIGTSDESDDEEKIEEITKALDGLNDVQEDITKSLITENEIDKDPESSLGTENPCEQLKSDVPTPEIKMEENNVHEEIVDELTGKSEQLFNANSLEIGNEDIKVEVSPVVIEDLASEILNSNDLKDNAEIETDSERSFPDEVTDLESSLFTKNSSEQLKSDVSVLESGMEEKNVLEETVDELKGKSEALFDTLDELHLADEVNVNSLKIGNKDIKGSFVDTKDLASEILNSSDVKDSAEIEMDSENAFTKESGAEIFNSSDLKDNAEIKMDSEILFPYEADSYEGDDSLPLEHITFTNEVEPSLVKKTTEEVESEVAATIFEDVGSLDSNRVASPINSTMKKNIARTPCIKGLNLVTDDKENIDRSGMKFEPAKEVGSLDSNRVASPINSTMKKNIARTPCIKGLNLVTDDKENIDRSGMKFEPAKEVAKTNNEDLNAKSLRVLTKMLKEKLQISNTTEEEVAKLMNVRPALQKVEDNIANSNF